MDAMSKIGFLSDADLFRQQGLVGGAWRDADSTSVVEVFDPATLKVMGTVPDMGADETRAAIDAAAAAFKTWKKKTHAERAVLLERWHDLLIQHEQDLALLLTLEQGKPLAESARGDPLWCFVRQMVRRGSAAHRRIDHSLADRRSPHSRAEGSGRCLRHHHAVELSPLR